MHSEFQSKMKPTEAKAPKNPLKLESRELNLPKSEEIGSIQKPKISFLSRKIGKINFQPRKDRNADSTENTPFS